MCPPEYELLTQKADSDIANGVKVTTDVKAINKG